MLRIVLQVLGGHPVQIRGMAGGAVVGEISQHVIGVGRCFKILLVAGKAIRRRIGKTTPDMAFRAVRNFVPLGQGEKIVVYFVRTPARLKGVVALRAICRKAGCLVVWAGSCVVVFQVARRAIIPNSIELEV